MKDNPRRLIRTWGVVSVQVALALNLFGLSAAAALAGGEVVAWGDNRAGQCTVPEPNTGIVAISVGWYHNISLKLDGSLVAWGDTLWGQCDVPEPNADFAAAAASGYHSIGLKSDGSIVAWGDNRDGQCDIPEPNRDFAAIAVGSNHNLGLKSDSSIVAWGYNGLGQCDVPAPNADFVAIAGGHFHSLGIKADGSIVAWGSNPYGQCDVPVPNTDFLAVAGGYNHSLGLKTDGSIVAWGRNQYGQCDVPAPNADFVAIAGGFGHSLGLKSDGSIVAWGSNSWGQRDTPDPNSDFAFVGAGWDHSVGLKGHSLIRSITDVGNDQGRQVRLEWRRIAYDAPGSAFEIGSYEIYRRQNGPVDGRSISVLRPTITARIAGWDYLTTVPAHGDSIYQTVVPTVCDSTAADGMCWSIFLVRATTPDPYTFFDSFPDSGCSVDNLAPSVPTDLQLVVTVLTWDECPDEDFNFFTVYGSETGEMRDGVLIENTVDPTMDLQAFPFSWYHVTATDFAGNEGNGATIQNPEVAIGVSGFTAEPENRAVLLSWFTSFEYLHDGFNVYRSWWQGSRYERLNDGLLRGRSPYSYLDHTVEPSTTYFYRLGAVDLDGTEVLHAPTSVTTPAWGLRTELRFASPNPFRDETDLSFTLAAPAKAKLQVYDVAGRLVRTLIDERCPEGDHPATWDGRDNAGERVAGGTYFVKLTDGEVTRTRKVVYIGAR